MTPNSNLPNGKEDVTEGNIEPITPLPADEKITFRIGEPEIAEGFDEPIPAKDDTGEAVNCILFSIPVKEHWDEYAKAWVYTNEEYNLSGYGQTKKEAGDMLRDTVSDFLVFTPHKQEKGEWQCCPVCMGTGRAMNMNNPIPTTLDICTVCNGKKIIERP